MKCFQLLRLLTLCFFLMMEIVHVYASETFTENGLSYTVLKDSNYLSVTGYTPSANAVCSNELHIPAVVVHDGKKYNVDKISSNAFRGVVELQSVVIEDGMKTISSNAFGYCTNLRSVYIPASVDMIANQVFGSCGSLKSIVVDAKNDTYDSCGGCNAIIDTDRDELVIACNATVIPASVKSIARDAFFYCSMVEHIDVPEGVERIGSEAFWGCGSLKSISLPESLVGLGYHAFRNCCSLASVKIPKNVKEIGEGNIFAGCFGLVSVSVDKANAFYDSRSGCNGIVRKADSTLVAACRTTTLCNDIRAIGDGCFYDMIKHSIHIPEAVTRISERAFDNCYELDRITVAKGNSQFISPEGTNALLSRDGKTLVLGGRMTIIPQSVENIGDCAFDSRYMNSILVLPEKIQTIGASAFENCGAIREVILPETLKSIGIFAFNSCKNLVVAKINTTANIPLYAFSGCSSLSTVSLPEGMKSIHEFAFSNCPNLRRVTIPSTVVDVDRCAFNASTQVIKK